MKLSEIKALLPRLDKLVFLLEDGKLVPRHFHVTEIGAVTKHFIDCGGTARTEKRISFRLWVTDDTDHRLEPGKLAHVIALSERQLALQDGEIDVEYQNGTIDKYTLDFDGYHFLLKNKTTICLATESCGIAGKPKPQPGEPVPGRETNSIGCCLSACIIQRGARWQKPI